MSDFWELWSKAEKGDTEAAHQVNVLVAKRNGYFERVNGDYFEVVSPKGETLNTRIFSTSAIPFNEWSYLIEQGLVPDYMSDLNAAAGLRHDPDDELSTIIRFIYRSPVVEVSIRRYHTDLIAMCESASEARARVGAWWAVVTGEKQPEAG